MTDDSTVRSQSCGSATAARRPSRSSKAQYRPSFYIVKIPSSSTPTFFGTSFATSASSTDDHPSKRALHTQTTSNFGIETASDYTSSSKRLHPDKQSLQHYSHYGDFSQLQHSQLQLQHSALQLQLSHDQGLHGNVSPQLELSPQLEFSPQPDLSLKFSSPIIRACMATSPLSFSSMIINAPIVVSSLNFRCLLDIQTVPSPLSTLMTTRHC